MKDEIIVTLIAFRILINIEVTGSGGCLKQ